MKKTLIIVIIILINIFSSLVISNIAYINNIKNTNNENEILNIDKLVINNKFSPNEIQIFEEFSNMINDSYLELLNSENENECELFFINNENTISITNAFIELGKSRTGMTREKIYYIVIHDTGNTNPKANAYSHYNYLLSDPGTSWHYTVDESYILHHIPDNEIAFHAGDGLREYGGTYFNTIYNKTSLTGGNKNGIGIETCVNDGSNYIKTLKNTASLVYSLLKKYNLNIDSIKKHYDFSGKMCPNVIIKNDIWNDFIDYIKLIEFYEKYLKDYDIQYVPVKNIDSKGTILNKKSEVIYTIKFKKDNMVYIKNINKSI